MTFIHQDNNSLRNNETNHRSKLKITEPVLTDEMRRLADYCQMNREIVAALVFKL